MKKNTIHLLSQREYGVKCSYRHNCNIMRELVLQPDAKFKKIWQRRAKHPILCEGGKLYFDQYRTCFTNYGMNGVPMQLYKLPHCTSAQKIEEGIICQSTLEDLCLEHKGYKPAFLALTADNWLVRHDLETGDKLQEVFLSNKYKFRHLSWESDLYTIVLRSTHSKLASVARQAGFTHSPLMSLAVFTVFPLNIVAVMEVSKQVFGHDVTDAMISQGLLVVMHQGGGVRLYSFETVLLEGKQFNLSLQSTHSGGRGKTGSYPDGIPCNVNLKEAPPVLFHVRCSEHNLQLGGIPWHYMLCPQGQRGFFHVYSLDKQHLAEEGVLDMEILSVEPDKAFFHPDDSGRIVHVGPNQLRVLKLTPGHMAERSRVTRCYTIHSKDNKTANQDSVTFTSSGRVVKKRISEDMYSDCILETIQSVNYENDLDLLIVTSVHQDDEGLSGRVCFHDNQTGKLLKEVLLEEPWKEFCDHVIEVDMDTIVHTVKGPMRLFGCYMYRLVRDTAKDDDNKDDTIKTKPKRNVGVSRTRQRTNLRTSSR